MGNSWYEATKLLPASVKDVRISFLVRGLGGPWEVRRVDRRNGCHWVADASGRKSNTFAFGLGHHEIEEFRFRQPAADAVTSADTMEPVDAVFELCGPLHGCYVARAWNSARVGAPARWEQWDDSETRPAAAETLPVLAAANRVPLPRAGF